MNAGSWTDAVVPGAGDSSRAIRSMQAILGLNPETRAGRGGAHKIPPMDDLI